MSPPLRPTALAPALRPEADAAPPASDARECTVCPEWIGMCAHFDGQLAYLLDRQALPPAIYAEWITSWDGRYFVFPSRLETDDYDAALRAFRDAEVRLLQGEEEGL